MAEELNVENNQTNVENDGVYQIYEVLAAAAEWLSNPADEQATLEFEKLKSNLIVKEYMPLAQKELCIRKALIDVRTDEEGMPYTTSILFEISLLFNCLLAYVVNLNPHIDSIYKDATFYDLIVTSGLKDYVLSYCEKDYNEMVKLADRMLSFDNLKELVNNFKLTSPEQIERLTREFESFRTETNPETIKNLADIMAADDPILSRIKKEVEDVAFNATQKIED